MAKIIGKYFSKSSLGIFECPRCGYIKVKRGIDTPRGIFPSLPGGMDLRLKDYFDKMRAQGTLPECVKAQVAGTLFPDQVKLNGWRGNWRTGPMYVDPAGRFTLGCMLDDLLLEGDGMHGEDLMVTPLDYKTRGSAPKSIDDTIKYYGLQMDIQAKTLEALGYKTSGKAHLAYFYPEEARSATIIHSGLDVAFACEVHTIETVPDRSIAYVEKVLEILKSEVPPEASPDCELCAYIKERQGGC